MLSIDLVLYILHLNQFLYWLYLFVFSSTFSGSDCDVVWKILCMVCKKGMKEGEESSCTHSAKPPPLLEEELALTVSSLIRLSDGSRRAAPLFC